MSAEIDRAQLARILGMLGSAHDGEVVAAGRMAERMRAAAGATWFEPLSPPPPAIASRVAVEPPETLDEAIGLCRDYPEHTTEWERNFIASISRRPHCRRLSEKQLRVLTRVVRRILDAEMPA
jgi:hypothetical protein